MKVEITPTEKIKVLKENLERHVEDVKAEDGELTAETDNIERLRKTPGIESFRFDGKEEEGLKGSPVDEQAYAKIESERDAVKALIATINGYDLRILNSGRQWDLNRLKEYNPDIKHLKVNEPRNEFGIEKSISEVEATEVVEIDVPEKEDMKTIYREMLT